ncbi:aminotransferase class III-fold pyridoxal phosphate-dependent enzyme [Maribacter sp. 2308TA10-17]|uniref:aminotransferase class III-fold pyridoxal phosphate-dependent enzyme n=1 Tax=Maribacter sp. 2308TA10-17 TaxID=3386276 RepID=UPI0039BCF37D
MNIHSILRTHYGITSAAVTSLEGYDSTNYKIQNEKGLFVLKQNLHSEETLELLQAENKLLENLKILKDYDFPMAVSSLKNETVVVLEKQIFRLLSFVKGDFLGDVPHTPGLLHSFGIFLAKMDKQIHTEYDPAISGKETQWDLKHFRSNYKYLKYIPDSKARSLVDYFFLQFDEQVLPVEYELRKGIIHNDGNDWNVLTQNGEVSGIIDFGDMCHSWLINEVAIAITYVMMNKEEPLEIASHLIQGYHSILPLEENELDILYYLVAARLCTSVCNSAYTKTLKPDSEYITISEKPAWDLLYKWITINPLRAKNAFRKAAGYPNSQKKTNTEQAIRRQSNFSDALSLSYGNPIQMHRSAFQYMYDTDGNTFLDAYNNIMLAGHCHPKVVRAGQKTMAKLNTNTRYLYEELLSYSEKLLAKFPKNLNKIFFVNSGSAASDLAVRMATTHAKKQKVMVLEHGYHGNTRMGIDISHYKYNHEGGSGRKDYIIETPMPKVFGSGYEDPSEAGDFFANQTKNQITDAKGEIAAFIAEPIVGCGGQVPLAKGYLKQVYQEIRAQGGVCISDEVQVGFGRLGDFFWGYEMYDVVPDMVILGKPMGNGHPIGAVVTTTEIAENFDNGLEFFSSFGGNPISCTIGQAVLEVIEKEELQRHAKEVGDYLIDQLKSLQSKYPELADVRGSGLFIGVEIFDKKGHPNTQLASDLKNALRENHILISTDGPFDSVLKIKPPLTFNRSNTDHLIYHLELQLQHFLSR